MIPSARPPAVATPHSVSLLQPDSPNTPVDSQDEQLAAGYRANAEAMVRQNAEFEHVIIESLKR